MSAKKIFSDTNPNVFVLTKEEISTQEPVFRWAQSVFKNLMLPWAVEFFQNNCLPTCTVTHVGGAKEFSKNLAIISESMQRSMEEKAPLWLKTAQDMRKQKKFSTSQYALAMRARNVASLFLSLYVRKQWRQAAIFSIFFKIIESEIEQDFVEAAKIANYDSFQVCQDGYDVLYKRETSETISIGEHVETRLQHAGFGRLLIWAAKLFEEMKEFILNDTLESQVLYAPIYVYLKRENLSAILEFFMRQMYVFACENIESIGKQDSQFTEVTSAHIEKYFNVSRAIARNLLVSSKLNNKQAKKSEDADPLQSKEFLLCGKTQYAPTCLPHNRLIATTLQVAEAKNLFRVLVERAYALFGSELFSRESSKCLWVVWLQNVQQLFSLPEDKRKDPQIKKLYMGTLKPKHFCCIMDMLREFIVMQSNSLLKETGFDLNQNSLLQKLLAYASQLCDFYSIVNICIHERQFKQ